MIEGRFPRHPLMMTSFQCSVHTARLEVYAFAAEKSRPRAINVPQFHSFMRSKKFGIFGRHCSRIQMPKMLPLRPMVTAVVHGLVCSRGTQLFMALSIATSSDSSTYRTMQLLGSLARQEVCILIDLGSSHSFVSPTVVSKIPGVQ